MTRSLYQKFDWQAPAALVAYQERTWLQPHQKAALVALMEEGQYQEGRDAVAVAARAEAVEDLEVA